MKTQKAHSRFPKLKTLAKFGSVITVALMLFSCGGNNGSNNNNNGFWGYQNGMVSGQTFFASQSTDTSNRLAISLNFMGNMGMNPYNQFGGMNQMGFGYGYGYSSPVVSYQGQTMVTGQMQIMQTLGNWGCVIPAGTYSVQTIQPGMWSSAIVTGLSLVATGPAQIMLSIPQAQVSAKGASGATWSETAPMGRLFGNLMIQSVNGMSCQMSTLIQ